MKRIINVFKVLMVFCVILSCEKWDYEQKTTPVVIPITGKIEITTTNIIQDEINATVVSFIRMPQDGRITAYGHCWSFENPTPSINDFHNKNDDLNHDTTFQSVISSLQPAKYYFVNAYAKIDTQIFYSNTLRFYTGDLWRKLDTLHGLPNRIKSSMLTINNKLYVGLGVSIPNGSFTLSVHLQDWWCYDLTSQSWTQVADFPGTGRASAFAFSLGDKGYVGSGYVEEYPNAGSGDFTTEYFTDFFAFNSISNLWVKKTNFPVPRAETVAFTLDNYGYVGTGSKLSSFNSILLFNNFWSYDPNDISHGLDINGDPKGDWIQKAPLPGTARGGAVSFTIGQYGYVGTGRRGVITCGYCVLNDFWQYDPYDESNGFDTKGRPKGKWVRKADVGNFGRYGAFGFSSESHGYVGGGTTSSASNFEALAGSLTSTFYDIWKYDPPKDKWVSAKFIPDGLPKFFAPAFSTINRGFVMETQTKDYQALWEYIPLK